MTTPNPSSTVAVPLVETERALLSVILSEPATLIPVWNVLQPDDFYDALCGRIYAAALDLAHQAKVPNAYTIANCLPDIPIDVILDIQARVNVQLIEEVLALADIVRQEAIYRRVAATAQKIATQAQKRPANIDNFVAQASTELARTVENRVEHPCDLQSIGQESDAEMFAEQPVTGITTGFDWLTERIGGFRPGNIVMLVAAYKSRKTSVARTMALAAARAKKNVVWYALEGMRLDLYNDLLAMLATEHLHRTLAPSDFLREAYIDSVHLHIKLRSALQHQALLRARKDMDDLVPYLHLVDARDGINDLAHFKARVQRDLFLYRTDEIIVDHIQLMQTGATDIFKRVEATTAFIQYFAVREGVVCIGLSQRSEAAINGSADNYSPGAKGGGDIPAAADHVILPLYDGEKEPDLLTLKLHFARRALAGKKQYIINAPSGYVLGEYQG